MLHAESFDLRYQPWLPVRTVHGDVRVVSLLEAFGRAEEFQALTGELPTQVLALYRLLLAVLFRAVDWDRDDPVAHWERAWRGEVDLAAGVRRYLDRFPERFDLLHPRSPFLQVADLRTGKGEWSPLTSLIADVPNNAQFFTTRAGRSLEAISYAEAARWLVHTHAFDVSGIKSGALGDPRVRRGKGYPIGVGWAGQIGAVLIEGTTLRETLLLNLVLLDAEGQSCLAGDRPVWERPPLGAGPEDDTESGRPLGPADQLTWPSRRIRLHTAGSMVVGVLIANGDPLAAHNRHRTETMTGWRRSVPQEKKLKSSTPVYLPRLHQAGRALWRELPALWNQVGVPQPRRDPDLGRPPGVLDWAHRLLREHAIPEDRPLRIRSVGVEYGSNNAVIDEIVDDTVRIHAVLLGERGHALRAAATDAVAAAEAAVLALANLAGNLAVATGGDAAGARDRTRERAFFALDTTIRDWLAAVNPGDDPTGKHALWQRTVHREITEQGRALIAAAGIHAGLGREHRGRRVDSALAAIWFDAALATALPLADTVAAPTGARR